MIDWQASATLTAALAADPAAGLEAVQAAAAATPAFRNRDFELTPSAVLLDGARAREFAGQVAGYVAVLNRLLVLYRQEPRIRQFLRLSPVAHRLITAGPPERDEVAVCRLDGYLALDDQRVRVLEHNADAPAGTLFTPRINAMVDRVHRELGVDRAMSPALRLDQDGLFAQFLIDRARVVTGDRTPRVAVLQPEGLANVESAELVGALAERGAEAFLADPRAVEASASGVRFGGRPVDLCWNKVNTALWQELVEPVPDVVDRWAAALAREDFLHLNCMGSRYVAENKLALALLRRPWLAELLEPDERQVVELLLPVAHRLGDGDGPTRAELRLRAPEYVLKMPYDIRGDGVTIGRGADRREWLDALVTGWREHHLAQRFVPPTAFPVLHADGLVRPLSISLDTFVFGGRPVGFGAKASSGDKVNVFRGGRKIAVRVCEEGS